MADRGDASSEKAWDKLRRRKVVQWGLAYAAAAWALLQGFGFAAATFRWPEVGTRIAAIVAAIGLPITITLAWYHGDRGHQRVVRMELALLAALLAIGAYGVIRVASERGAPSAATATPANGAPADRHRIAVLPFANLGDDPANVAFAGGVHDTLITQIAKIPGLSVISRSSVLQFADRQPTIHEVSTTLNVGAVLEGSVQRDGNRLRIQAQLIDAETDAHLWAETYDRDSGDLFAVQSEIAQAVAEQLRIRLTGNDSRRLSADLTGNPVAYEHYVLGRSHVARQEWSDAIREMTAAVTLDPTFAAAHAQLSLSRTWLAFDDGRLRKDLLPLARSSAERALELDPTLPEGHLALAVYFYRGDPDIHRAASEFERAVAGLPNDAVAHLNFGYLRRWQGRIEEAAALFARAAELDPRGPSHKPYVQALATLGRREEVLQAISNARAGRPDDAWFVVLPGVLAANFDCDLRTYEQTLAAVPVQFASDRTVLQERWFFGVQTGDGARALEVAEQLAGLPGSQDDDSIAWRRAQSYLAAGDHAAAERFLREALRVSRDELTRAAPGDALAGQWSWVALELAQLGERAPAIEAARRAVKALPSQGAALQKMDALLFAAAALAHAGETGAAVEQMRIILAQPFEVKPSGLWCDPLLAPLRADPDYRKLMAEHGVDVNIDPFRRETWPRAPSESLHPRT